MVTEQLIRPRSIVVVGASNDIRKPGGKILENLLSGGFKGELYVSNPKEDMVQGVKSYRKLEDLPKVDLAILGIAAKYCKDTISFLSHNRETRAFIIISAGFSESGEDGARLEREIVDIIEETGSCLIGPNCIGVINTQYVGCFTLPTPKLHPQGVDFISGSGATAVYVMENAIPNGLVFNSIYSVGNSAQLGVEDILEYLDESFDESVDSKVKLLYLEAINKPDKLLKHASSLVRKGCRIAAIKAGYSEAGGRAASSHTGAMASSDIAIDALFRKAGIVRCYSREELATVAGVFMHKKLEGPNIAIITHAGGPAVMLTDVLTDGGINVPDLSGKDADELMTYLYEGSSVSNPIDILATGSVSQLDACIEFADKRFKDIDGIAVIFGSPGLSSVDQEYNLLVEKMDSCEKPLFPILPSVINARNEIRDFLSKGRINFPDEVVFGKALVNTYQTLPPADEAILPLVDHHSIRSIIDSSGSGYLDPADVQVLLEAAGIQSAKEIVVDDIDELQKAADKIGFPLVMKVVGPVHKSDVGGVVLNIRTIDEAKEHFHKLMNIQSTRAVLLQAMLQGRELFIGAKEEGDFGHLVMCGLGGIFIEVLKDVQVGLAPLNDNEVVQMVGRLRGLKLLTGTRGQSGINLPAFYKAIKAVAALVTVAPEIIEMDLNPLLGTVDNVFAVDARIRVK